MSICKTLKHKFDYFIIIKKKKFEKKFDGVRGVIFIGSC